MVFVPISWLKDHVEVAEGTDATQLARDLVRVGLEEERIVPPPVQGPLVVGHVLTMEAKKQKNGKVINYCRVDVGKWNDKPGEGAEPSELASRGIICGAHNFGEGDYVVVSLPGAILPGDFQIAARKTYGHISDGMICSERELGLSTQHDGILVLTEKFDSDAIPQPGESVIDLLGLGEEILDINITPDRGYCFSMRGIAREYSHSTGAQFSDPGLEENLPGGHVPEDSDGFAVEIHDDAPIRSHVGCDRFVARLIEDIDPSAPTPQWMQKRLEAMGMRSVSLPVDITNYVMLDVGQPLHAYDADQLVAPIVVRRAHEGEKLTTLDDHERTLDPEDLVITDSPHALGERVLSIAGVMGGAHSEVTESTTRILLEAAHFDPITVARSSRRHHIASEAAKRNERGVDTALAGVAAQRAAELLVKYAGGTISPQVTDIDTTTAPEAIVMSIREPQRLTGVEYPRESVIDYLRTIGCDVREDADTLIVVPPTWRPDLAGPADLVEEVARLAGYDIIPSRVPTAPAGHGLTTQQRSRRQVAQFLADSGLTQVLSYPFIGDAHDRQGFAPTDPRRRSVKIANPLTEEAPGLRTSVLDTLLPTAERNVARGNTDIAIYEIGSITDGTHVKVAELPGVTQRPSDEEIAALEGEIPAQPWHIASIMVGRSAPVGVTGTNHRYSWADAIDVARGVARTLGVPLEISTPDCDHDALLPFHPGRVAHVSVNGISVGYAGELHPKVAREYSLGERPSACELDLSVLVEQSEQLPPLHVSAISTFPAVKEDMAFVVPRDVPAADVAAVIHQAGGDIVEAVELFDVYEGEQVEEGYKSQTFALRLRADDKTLSSKEISAIRKKIIKRVGKRLGATLRA